MLMWPRMNLSLTPLVYTVDFPPASSSAYTTFMSYLHIDASSLRNEFECMTFI